MEFEKHVYEFERPPVFPVMDTEQLDDGVLQVAGDEGSSEGMDEMVETSKMIEKGKEVVQVEQISETPNTTEVQNIVVTSESVKQSDGSELVQTNIETLVIKETTQELESSPKNEEEINEIKPMEEVDSVHEEFEKLEENVKIGAHHGKEGLQEGVTTGTRKIVKATQSVKEEAGITSKNFHEGLELAEKNSLKATKDVQDELMKLTENVAEGIHIAKLELQRSVENFERKTNKAAESIKEEVTQLSENVKEGLELAEKKIERDVESINEEFSQLSQNVKSGIRRASFSLQKFKGDNEKMKTEGQPLTQEVTQIQHEKENLMTSISNKNQQEESSKVNETKKIHEETPLLSENFKKDTRLVENVDVSNDSTDIQDELSKSHEYIKIDPQPKELYENTTTTQSYKM